jgi:hypothetical protein
MFFFTQAIKTNGIKLSEQPVATTLGQSCTQQAITALFVQA